MTTTPSLSKSRFQAGRQCHRRLWLDTYKRDLAHHTPSAQVRLDEGTRFGELARKLLGEGHLVDAPYDQPALAAAQSAECLAQPHTEVPLIFEASFEHRGVRVRVDALRRTVHGEHLIEVKSSASVKLEYLWDCAIQTWVLRGAGRSITHVFVANVNRNFTLTTPDNYDGLLHLEDVTEAVENLLPKVEALVQEMFTVIAKEEPNITTGRQCNSPYPCPYFDHCSVEAEPKVDYPIDALSSAPALVERLREQGYRDLRDVPENLIVHPTHRHIAEAVRSGKPYISKELKEILGQISYPRHYLDFETVSFAIPRWIGTRPFQPIPFQFSCHTEHPDGRIQHVQFIDLSGESPIKGFIQALLSAIKPMGTILVWSRSFEADRVRDLARIHPEYAEQLISLTDHMLDLLPIYRAHYYHRDMHGSWSIKSVLPTVAPELNYASLDINDGRLAHDAYLQATNALTDEKTHHTLRQNLLRYCERDTWAMVRLAHLTDQRKLQTPQKSDEFLSLTQRKGA